MITTATITFQLSGDDDDRELYEQHMNGPRAHGVLFHMDQYFKHKLQHEEMSKENREMLEDCLRELNEVIESEGLTVW